MKIATLLKHYNAKKSHRQEIADEHSRELADKVDDIEQSHHCNAHPCNGDDVVTCLLHMRPVCWPSRPCGGR